MQTNTHANELYSLVEILKIGYCSFYMCIFEELNINIENFKEAIEYFSDEENTEYFLEGYLKNASIEMEQFSKAFSNKLKYNDDFKRNQIVEAFEEIIHKINSLDPKEFLKTLKNLLEKTNCGAV